MIYKNIFTIALCFFNIFYSAYSTASAEKPNLPQNHVTIGDKRVLLMGNSVPTGALAPEFSVVDEQFKPVRLSDFSGKILLLSIVPSIDTGICSLQTKRFNDEVLKLPAQVKLLSISTDLPFAQKRFCIEESVDQIQLLSDAVWRDFGLKYGLLIRDMGLLSRAVMIIDAQGKLVYQQIVSELAKQPNYDEALAALKQLLPQQPELEPEPDEAEDATVLETAPNTN